MNEIWLRTHKGVYESGHNIYGVVYLKIVTPTSGASVFVRIKCDETVSHTTTQDGQPLLLSVNHVDIGPHEVYRSQCGAIPCGKYAFPFRMILPFDAPGSFHFGAPELGVQEAAITYKLHVYVDEDECLSSYQLVVVTHCTQHMIVGGTPQFISMPLPASPAAVPPSALSEKHPVPLFLGVTVGYIHFEIGLLSKSCTFEGKPKMSISVRNTSPRTLKELRVMVIRTIALALTTDCEPDVISSKELMSINLKNLPPALLESGITGLVLPFVNLAPADILAQSTIGKHIQCSFNVHVEAELGDGATAAVIRPSIIPLEVHASLNPKWLEWSAPTWISCCKIVKAYDPMVAVTCDVLSSEAFEGLVPDGQYSAL